MARKVQVLLVDDLTDEVADDVQTVTFGLDGTMYEIDLTEKNAGDMRDTLTRYVQAARRIKGGTAKAQNKATANAKGNTANNTKAKGLDAKVVRAWAVENKLLAADSRGRIPGEVIEKYQAAVQAGKADA